MTDDKKGVTQFIENPSIIVPCARPLGPLRVPPGGALMKYR